MAIKFYLFDGRAAQGPFEPVELLRRPDFDGESMVCPAGSQSADDWRPALAYEILREALLKPRPLACPRCADGNVAGALYCGRCGEKLAQPSAAPAPVPPAAVAPAPQVRAAPVGPAPPPVVATPAAQTGGSRRGHLARLAVLAALSGAGAWAAWRWMPAVSMPSRKAVPSSTALSSKPVVAPGRLSSSPIESRHGGAPAPPAGKNAVAAKPAVPLKTPAKATVRVPARKAGTAGRPPRQAKPAPSPKAGGGTSAAEPRVDVAALPGLRARAAPQPLEPEQEEWRGLTPEQRALIDSAREQATYCSQKIEQGDYGEVYDGCLCAPPSGAAPHFGGRDVFVKKFAEIFGAGEPRPTFRIVASAVEGQDVMVSTHWQIPNTELVQKTRQRWTFQDRRWCLEPGKGRAAAAAEGGPRPPEPQR